MENQEAKWYIIYTQSMMENAVETDIRNMVENCKWQDRILDIKVPVLEDIVEKNGKKKTVEKKKFPGYVFIKCIYSQEVGYGVLRSKGAKGWLGAKGAPQALLEEEVRRMGLEEVAIEDFDIKEGDTVKVINGALENFMGTVENINLERQKVKVVVQMFGRLTPVELEFSQVEKLGIDY